MNYNPPISVMLVLFWVHHLIYNAIAFLYYALFHKKNEQERNFLYIFIHLHTHRSEKIFVCMYTFNNKPLQKFYYFRSKKKNFSSFDFSFFFSVVQLLCEIYFILFSFSYSYSLIRWSMLRDAWTKRPHILYLYVWQNIYNIQRKESTNIEAQ